MDKEDARKLRPEQQKEKRKIVLRMRMNGYEFAEIGETVGVHPRTLQCWWSRYHRQKASSLRSTVGKYLKRWGFTPQKPLKKAYEQKPELVAAWLKERYPGIAQHAKDEGAEIHWGDETGVRSDCQSWSELCTGREDAD